MKKTLNGKINEFELNQKFYNNTYFKNILDRYIAEMRFNLTPRGVNSTLQGPFKSFADKKAHCNVW